MKRRKVTRSIFTMLLLCVIAGVVWLFYSYSTRVYKHCMTEAGTEVTAEDFLRDASFDAAFVADSSMADTSVPGDYEVTVKSGFFTYRCTLTVQDTIPPKAETQTVTSAYGEPVGADSFMLSVQDATAVTVTYIDEPDYECYGPQEVKLLLTDLGGNTTTCETTLVVSPVVERLEIEAGSEKPRLSDFLLTGQTEEAVLLSSVQDIDMSTVGEYEIQIQMNGYTYTSLLAVVDTVLPILQVQDVTAYTTSDLQAEDFVVLAQDATTLTCSFLQEPDMTRTGTQEVTVWVEDEGGNSVMANANLTLAEDTEAPVLAGVKDITVFIGDSVSYKTGVKATDNCDGEISFQVDNSKVDLNTEGSYQVIYSAKDRAGNETSATVTVTVRKRAYSIEEVDALADKVLEKIITDDMNQYDKLTAIYKWVRGHVGYINHSDKGDWVKAAYEGLALGQGDCYVFACVAKELLTRAGITNMDIEKIPAKTEHYWNLVDIGEGWYHYDTCPRKDKSVFCYVSDADLMEYSNAHNGSHNYDKTIYTNIQ